MKIIGSKRDSASKGINWEYAGDNKLIGKKSYKLKTNPEVKVTLKDKDKIKEFVQSNCYYEVCDLESVVKLPLKIGSTIYGANHMGKENFIPIKFSTIDNDIYRIEIYDPIKNTLEFGAPLFAFNFYPNDLGRYDNTDWYGNNKEYEDLNKFILALRYVIARHYDMAINRMLSIKQIDNDEFCLNTKTNNIEDIVNNDVISIDINTKQLIIDFINRSRKSFLETPKQSIGMFGNFNIGLSPVHGSFLILRLDNDLNCISAFIGKAFNNLKHNSARKKFTSLETLKELDNE